MSITGIVLSLAFGAAYGIGGEKLAHSTAADPGCVSAESDARQMDTVLSADSTALSKDGNDASAVKTDLQKFQNDMHSLEGQLSSARAQAQHESVKTQIAALTSDINTLSASLQAVQKGDFSQVNQMNTAATKLQTDGNALDTTCSTL